jgi:hypothetical protein
MGKITKILQYFIIFLLKGYSYFISPLLGRHCRFYPTCSKYAEQAVRKYGVFIGGYLSIRRIFRCHPWHAGGVDPVP